MYFYLLKRKVVIILGGLITLQGVVKGFPLFDIRGTLHLGRNQGFKFLGDPLFAAHPTAADRQSCRFMFGESVHPCVLVSPDLGGVCRVHWKNRHIIFIAFGLDELFHLIIGKQAHMTVLLFLLVQRPLTEAADAFTDQRLLFIHAFLENFLQCHGQEGLALAFTLSFGVKAKHLMSDQLAHGVGLGNSNIVIVLINTDNAISGRKVLIGRFRDVHSTPDLNFSAG